jgi:hypothetical protein
MLLLLLQMLLATEHWHPFLWKWNLWPLRLQQQLLITKWTTTSAVVVAVDHSSRMLLN